MSPTTRDINVRLTEVPQVAELLCRYLELLQAWEPRVRCPQCGKRYTNSACGPTHASVAALVHPPDAGS